MYKTRRQISSKFINSSISEVEPGTLGGGDFFRCLSKFSKVYIKDNTLSNDFILEGSSGHTLRLFSTR